MMEKIKVFMCDSERIMESSKTFMYSLVGEDNLEIGTFDTFPDEITKRYGLYLIHLKNIPSWDVIRRLRKKNPRAIIYVRSEGFQNPLYARRELQAYSLEGVVDDTGRSYMEVIQRFLGGEK